MGIVARRPKILPDKTGILETSQFPSVQMTNMLASAENPWLPCTTLFSGPDKQRSYLWFKQPFWPFTWTRRALAFYICADQWVTGSALWFLQSETQPSGIMFFSGVHSLLSCFLTLEKFTLVCLLSTVQMLIFSTQLYIIVSPACIPASCPSKSLASLPFGKQNQFWRNLKQNITTCTFLNQMTTCVM